ncbi:MAG: metallophosphoesterase family protein [Candidatus Aminicenantes bacterium]|nr:metallophosphoesterase family protein [Candidatus Aminicenantes bacterium]
MRYLVFTDIHGNREALEALLEFVSRKKIDRYLCLGDLVGYGASPDETIEIVRKLKPLSLIRGNHDKAVCGLDAIETFNPMAASAITWSRKTLSREHSRYLCGLPKGPLIVDGLLTICHGAPFDEDFYIFGEFDAAEAFLYLETRIGFFGHTHFPCVYVKTEDAVEGRLVEKDRSLIRLKKNAAYLINPGSVGQPRDRNPKAACALFDSEESTVCFYRFEYDIARAQEKILAQNLPPALAERLALGI